MKNNYFWLFLVVAGVLSIPARANNYTINFSGTTVEPPTAGSFTYIARPQGTGFSNFKVGWFGLVFDFTDAANGATASGCGTTTGPDPALAFALLEHSLVNTFGCPSSGAYMWTANAVGDGGQTFVFSYGQGGSTPPYVSISGTSNCTNASNNCGTIGPFSGPWTITSTNVIPEPGSFFLLAPAMLGLGVALRKKRLGQNSSATSL